MALNLDSQDSLRPDREEVGQSQVRDEAGESGQQAQVQRHRRGLRPGRRRGRGHPRRARLQREVLSASRIPRAARTPSPRRAASTPPRTIRTTATSVYRLFYDTIKGGDFRAREANVYRLAAGQRRTSSTSASRRAFRSPANTAACWPTAASAARRSRARSTRAARPASSCCSAPTRRSSARSTPAA